MNREPEAAPGSISDELVVATIGLIGILVDVHVIDGSVYSGIFYTASMDGDYAIVLKKARILKKGKLFANVVDDTSIDTLVIGSEHLVQIVAKAKAKKISFIDVRQEGDDLHSTKSWNENDPEDNRWTEKVKGSNLTGPEDHSDDQSTISQDVLENSGEQITEDSSDLIKPVEDRTNETPTSDEAVVVDSTPTICITSLDNVESESHLSDSSNPSVSVSPKLNDKKPHKLNPDAKMFSPSMVYNRAATPVPNVANFTYVPASNYMAAPLANAQDEVEASSFIHSPVPVKYVPYTNVDLTHGGNDGTYAQHVIGQMADRAETVRYASQYPNFQSGAHYIYPNSQTVAYGGVMPIMCMHPVSSGYSPATTPRHALTPNQGHALKYQEEMVQHSYYTYAWYPEQ